MVSVSQTSLGRLIFRYIRIWMLIHHFKMEAPARGYPGLEAARPVVLEKSFSSFGVYMDYLFSPFAVLKPLFIYIYIFFFNQHQQDHGSRNEFVFLLVTEKHSVAPKARLTHKYNTIGEILPRPFISQPTYNFSFIYTYLGGTLQLEVHCTKNILMECISRQFNSRLHAFFRLYFATKCHAEETQRSL